MTKGQELNDIINCIINFDRGETLKKKGIYFEIIQRDLRKLARKFKETGKSG